MIHPDKLLDWLGEQGFDPGLVEDDTEIVIPCPMCSDHRPRLYIAADSGAWVCFHCHEEGSLHQLIMNLTGLNGGHAYDLATDFYADPDEEYEISWQPRQPKKEANGELSLPPQFHHVDARTPERFLRYLVSRGVSTDLAAARGIGWAETGRYSNRVIVPVYMEGALYTYIARTILKNCPSCEEALNDCTCTPHRFPKVLTPRSVDGARPSHAVYNFDAVSKSTSPRVVVVEGAFDALRLPSEAVATMSSSASAIQRALIAGLVRGRDCIIAYDADQAGYLGAIKLAEHLTAQMIPVKVALLPDGKDPGSLKRSELEQCLSEARRFVI